jgi:hypothetical protein
LGYKNFNKVEDKQTLKKSVKGEHRINEIENFN